MNECIICRATITISCWYSSRDKLLISCVCVSNLDPEFGLDICFSTLDLRNFEFEASWPSLPMQKSATLPFFVLWWLCFLESCFFWQWFVWTYCSSHANRRDSHKSVDYTSELQIMRSIIVKSNFAPDIFRLFLLGSTVSKRLILFCKPSGIFFARAPACRQTIAYMPYTNKPTYLHLNIIISISQKLNCLCHASLMRSAYNVIIWDKSSLDFSRFAWWSIIPAGWLMSHEWREQAFPCGCHSALCLLGCLSDSFKLLSHVSHSLLTSFGYLTQPTRNRGMLLRW